MMTTRSTEDNDCDARSRKRRCQWTSELHAAFEDAMRKAGPRPTPTSVHAALDVSHLNLDFEVTVAMVKSHLQKYKLDRMCAGQIAVAPSPPSPKLRDAEGGLLSRRNSDAAAGRTSVEKRPRGEPILVTMLDAQAAMGVLVRTFTGYALSFDFEADTNTLVLKASPPGTCSEDHAAVFGLKTLPLLADAKVSAAGIDELGLDFTRRCALSCTPASDKVSDWTAQIVSTGSGDKTVLIMIPKKDGHCVPPGQPAGMPLVM
mmetsp:Transcript_21556/g.55470  ORF Transcript_21556/g.55470 Transcript_21556/m.55470 type:complete len:260 (-) Transcript_21556:579-1358(-)